MPLKDLLKDPLDLTAPDASTFMARVQGNILKGHDRNHTAHLFVRFGADVGATRAWIARDVSRRLISAERQSQQSKAWRVARGRGEPFFVFVLSHHGYQTLGIDAALIPNDPYFRAGMKGTPDAGPALTDPPSSDWEKPFQDDIDAMVLVADDDRTRLDGIVAELAKEIAGIGAQHFVERGDVQTFDFGGGRDKVEIEHFGHQDGISQPRMIRQDADKEIAERGAAHWNPTASLSLGIVEEPGRPDHFGSYLVFRKLGQNVQAFRAARDGLAAALGVGIEDAAALAVGRYRDGRPVLPTTVVMPGADPNDFSFKTDATAAVCPYQAHIRKTNPRGDLAAFIPGQTDESERGFRILRRGIPFGARPDLAPGSKLPPPSDGVGLLFMCYQSRLINFVIQQDGSDANAFVKDGVGPDPVLGVNAQPTAQQWPRDGNPNAAQFLMANFITLHGGEYFFAPSPLFLESL